mmetsp:Transcript_35726/g.52393  ORF Transcript_35726/g.52393 Transcript_35726/m.52393 type:complete len:275 (-) Transcript_35726:13-837(-)
MSPRSIDTSQQQQQASDGANLWEAILTTAKHDDTTPLAIPSLLNAASQPTTPPTTPPTPKMAFRQVSPPYLNMHTESLYNSILSPLLSPKNLSLLINEALSIPQWAPWPEPHYNTDGGSDWTVFPLCHTFPAQHVSNRKWIQSTCAHTPHTAQLLRKHLGNTLRTALFSRLGPRTLLSAHTGWEDLANHVLRVHVPLRVPPGGLCGVWVDGCVEYHRKDRVVIFDDSKVHRAFNHSEEERIMLIIDLERFDDLPRGTAVGGHTEELDKFIKELV